MAYPVETAAPEGAAGREPGPQAGAGEQAGAAGRDRPEAGEPGPSRREIPREPGAAGAAGPRSGRCEPGAGARRNYHVEARAAGAARASR
jgi:hypothetical protein